MKMLHLLSFLLMLLILPSTTLAMTQGIDLGTTLVALRFEDGVLVGADTRTSTSGYVSNKLAQKINALPNQCVICRSGSAADTQWLCQQVSQHLWQRQYRYGINDGVTAMAHYLRHLIRQDDDGFQASLICAGCDDEQGKIYSIASSGTLLEEEIFAVSGSGSTVLLGHLDSLNISKDNLYSEKDAVELVTKLLRLSIGRDGSSGGLIRLVIMKKGQELKEITIYPDPPSSKSNADIPGFAASKAV